MFAHFKRIDDIVFPGGGQIHCGLYEWCATNSENLGPFSVCFISPDNPELPRRYFVQPLLEQSMEGTETRFLEQACEFGYKFVADLNHHSPEQRHLYSLLGCLFRNRNAGHVGVGREFMFAQDFVDFSASPPTLLTPGIGQDQLDLPSDGFVGPGGAWLLLKEAFDSLRDEGMELPQLPLNFHGVLDVYERFTRETSRGGQGNSTLLLHVEDTESWSILSLLARNNPQTDFNAIENAIAGSLIYGTTTIQEDRAATECAP